MTKSFQDHLHAMAEHALIEAFKAELDALSVRSREFTNQTMRLRYISKEAKLIMEKYRRLRKEQARANETVPPGT